MAGASGYQCFGRGGRDSNAYLCGVEVHTIHSGQAVRVAWGSRGLVGGSQGPREGGRGTHIVLLSRGDALVDVTLLA